MDNILNIDKLSAEQSQNMVSGGKLDNLERLVTKALGVLQEHGVYAMMLFLLSRTGDEAKIAPIICKQLYSSLPKVKAKFPEFLKDIVIPDENTEKARVLAFYSSNEVMGDTNTLFLIRDLYEQTLIYARYGAKALKKEG